MIHYEPNLIPSLSFDGFRSEVDIITSVADVGNSVCFNTAQYRIGAVAQRSSRLGASS